MHENFNNMFLSVSKDKNIYEYYCNECFLIKFDQWFCLECALSK